MTIRGHVRDRQTVTRQGSPVDRLPIGVAFREALRNVGHRDAVLANFPTIPYDHANPDKYRLPLDTDQIPYAFERKLGW